MDIKRNEPAKISIGGNPLIPSEPKAFALTWEDGDRRLAVLLANPDNPETAKSMPDAFKREAVDAIKEQRGWDFKSYDLICCGPTGKHEEIVWAKDPFTQEPTFAAANRPLTEERVDGWIRSFGDNLESKTGPDVKPPKDIHTDPLSEFSMDPSLD